MTLDTRLVNANFSVVPSADLSNTKLRESALVEFHPAAIAQSYMIAGCNIAIPKIRHLSKLVTAEIAVLTSKCC